MLRCIDTVPTCLLLQEVEDGNIMVEGGHDKQGETGDFSEGKEARMV